MKSITKRLLALLTTTLFTMSFAGCGSQQTASSNPKQATSSNQKIKLKFWTFHTDAEKDFMASLGAEYTKLHPNVEIDYESIPQNDYMSTKLTTAFAANDGPDVFVMSPGDFLKYVNAGIAMDLSKYFTDDIKNDFLKASLDAVTVNQKIYAIPFEIELLGLYYDKDIFAKAGLQPPKTWDELVADTKALKTDKQAGMVVETTKGYYQNFTWYPFLWQAGGQVMDPATKQATFNSDAAVKSLQLMQDLIKAGAPSKLAKMTTDPYVGDGSSAMQIGGTWMIAGLEKNYPNKNIGVVPLPLPDGGKAATDAGGWKMMVNSKSPNADEAAKFAMWAFAQNVDLPLKWCTQTKFAFSPRKSVNEAGKDIFTKGLRKVFNDEIYSSAIPEPRYPAEVVNAIGDALEGVMYNNENPKDAAKKANDTIADFLKSYSGSM